MIFYFYRYTWYGNKAHSDNLSQTKTKYYAPRATP